MCAVDDVGTVLAELLPLVLVALLLILSLRWRKRRGDAPVHVESWSRRRSVTALMVVIAVAAAISGAVGGWSLESLLMPVGWLVTAVALVLFDRFLDRCLSGNVPKVVGPISFWWVFVWAAAIGWGYGIVSTNDSPWPTWASITVLVGLLLASGVAFCLRFGLRLGR
jgi:hypothetical protein